jgi:hypothetical protein
MIDLIDWKINRSAVVECSVSLERKFKRKKGIPRPLYTPPSLLEVGSNVERSTELKKQDI